MPVADAGIDALLRDAAEGVVPGVVALAADRSGIIYQQVFGRRAVPDGAAMTLDSVFWIASMTKAITAVAAMQLVEQRRMALDQPASELVPGLAAPLLLEGFDARGEALLRPARERITLRHLLTHTAGFAYENWNPLIHRYTGQRGLPGTSSGMLASLDAPLVAEPGTRWEYSIAIDWVGRIVEAVSGKPLERYLHDHIIAPLGMRDTGHVLRDDQRSRLAKLHLRDADGLHAVERATLSRPDFFPGGGGLHSTGPDYLRFLQMLLHDGRLGDAAVLRPETVALMAQDHTGALADRALPIGTLRTVDPALSHDFDPLAGLQRHWGLSFLVNAEDAPSGRAAGSMAWAGMGNTYYWVDRTRGVAGLLLTQIMPFADPAVLDLFEAFETAIYRSL